MEDLKRTPLYSLYKKYGGKVIDFGGWALPVQFQGIIEEHNCVRTHAGLFDVSHMGEIMIAGKDSLDFLQYISTNDISKLAVNQVMYTLFCYEDGGTVDDLLIYRLQDERFMLVVNASNIDKDLQWITTQMQSERWGKADIQCQDISNETALLAIQGPKAAAVLQQITNFDISTIKKFRFVNHVTFESISSTGLLSRTGYTGEEGFEIYVNANDAAKLWEAIMEVGEPMQLAPIGLGARDTLRFESKLPLYGQELTRDISPLEAGLGYFVKLDKGEFIGKAALALQKETGLTRKLVGFEMLDRGVARTGYPVYNDEIEIGIVTSGSFSPTLKKNIGLALVSTDFSDIGQEISIGIRNKKLKAEVIETPFLKKLRRN